MSERVDISNAALDMIGANRITSIEDTSKEAIAVKTHYGMARDAALEAYEWSFAVKRFTPAQSSDGPEYGYDYAFKVPGDIIRVVTVDCDPNASVTDPSEQADWTEESGYILTNDSVIYCRGIRRVEDEGSFTPLFVEAFVARLAMKLAVPLRGNRSLRNDLKQEFAALIRAAASRDGSRGRNRRLRNRSMQKARLGRRW